MGIQFCIGLQLLSLQAEGERGRDKERARARARALARLSEHLVSVPAVTLSARGRAGPSCDRMRQLPVSPKNNAVSVPSPPPLL
jgi:hypothetical protein